MSLSLTESSTDKITVTNPLTIGSGSKFTYIQWVKAYATSGNSRGTGKGSIDLFVQFSSQWFCYVPRATTASNAMVTVADMFPDTDWTFVVITYSESNGARIYRGNRSTVPAEMSYSTFDAGSGATSSDTGDLWIGNRSAVSGLAPAHTIAHVSLYDVEMTLGEIRRQWMHLHPSEGCKLFLNLGWNGTGTQPDWSGNGKSGAVTGSAVETHAPLGPAFGRTRRTGRWARVVTGSPWYSYAQQ